MASKLKLGTRTPPPTLVVYFEDAPIAELARCQEGYEFRYLAAFAAKGLPAFPGIPDPDKREPRSFASLPAFFKERIPDLHRPELQEFLKEFGGRQPDEWELLEKLGRRSVTDPFELRRAA